MPSISKRLFLILALTTGLVWLSAVVWIFLSTRAEVERVLDARLMEAGRMVSSLIVSQEIAPNATLGIGFGGVYGRKKVGGDVRITGGPRNSRKPAIKFVLRF